MVAWGGGLITQPTSQAPGDGDLFIRIYGNKG